MENNDKFDWTNLNKEIPMVPRKRKLSGNVPTMINNVIGINYTGIMKFRTVHNVTEQAVYKGQIKPTDTGWDRINDELLQAVINAKKQLLT